MRRTDRLRTPATVCKQAARNACAKAIRLAITSVAIAPLVACNAARTPQPITVEQLQHASPTAVQYGGRHVVSDPAGLHEFCTPLGPRLGLLQIRNPVQWYRLARVVPDIGPCPNFAKETVVGLVSWTGVPVDGQWPIEILTVRVHDGAGLLFGNFNGGTYLPDGTALLETARVRKLGSVVAVDINGTTFYPQR